MPNKALFRPRMVTKRFGCRRTHHPWLDIGLTSTRPLAKPCLQMNRAAVALIILCLACPAPGLRAVDPIPESKQAALAMKIIDAYHGPRPATPPKKLHLVYFTPADRPPADRYEQRLDAIMEDVRAFYRDGMQHAGFGPRTFALARDAQGKLIITLVKGKEPESAFPKWQGSHNGTTVSPRGRRDGVP